MGESPSRRTLQPEARSRLQRNPALLWLYFAPTDLCAWLGLPADAAKPSLSP